MDVNEAVVEGLEARTMEFAHVRGATFAAEWAETELEKVRAPFVAAGIDGTPPTLVDQHTVRLSQEWDAQSRTLGMALELDVNLALMVVREQIAFERQLSPTLDPPVSRQERQTEELVSLLAHAHFVRECATMTLTEGLRLYEGLNEAERQADRRFTAWLEQHWQTSFTPESAEHDAIAVSRWQKAIDARQRKRVTPEWFAWETRLEKAQSHFGFTSAMRLLREGRYPTLVAR